MQIWSVISEELNIVVGVGEHFLAEHNRKMDFIVPAFRKHKYFSTQNN